MLFSYARPSPHHHPRHARTDPRILNESPPSLASSLPIPPPIPLFLPSPPLLSLLTLFNFTPSFQKKFPPFPKTFLPIIHVVLNCVMNKVFKAARDADWMQVVLNQGPPCFHLEDGRFCLRAQRWHDEIAEKVCHKYVSLEDLLRKVSR